MIQVYASKSETAMALWVDQRSIKKLIKDKKVLVVIYKKTTRYIIAKEVFNELAE